VEIKFLEGIKKKKKSLIIKSLIIKDSYFLELKRSTNNIYKIEKKRK
jgi:DNA-binding HxlR family transcriptional regulator